MDLDSSTWGVRNVRPARHITERCRLLATRLRDDAFFTHSTAALLYGAPLPLEVEREGRLHVGLSAPHPALHAAGLIGHSLDLAETDIARRFNVRTTNPARTWFDLRDVLGLGDLVAVGDFFINREAPLVSIRELRRMLDRNTRRRNIRKSRAALALLSDRAESRPESLLRVILVQGGLPLPRVNYKVVNTEAGKDFRLDLAWPAQKLLLEYQGDYHRDRDQWRKDMTRRARLEAQGWYVMEINYDDLADPVELASRISTVLSRR